MNNGSGGGKKNWPVFIGIILIVIAGLLLFWLFASGKTTTSGNWPDPVTSESLSCEVSGLQYPFFTFDKSSKKTTKINIVLAGSKLHSLALIHELYYNDVDDIVGSEAINHAALNLSFAGSGLPSEALGANFSRLDNEVKLSLFIKADEINEKNSKYFLLDEITLSANNVIDKIKQRYEDEGFICTD